VQDGLLSSHSPASLRQVLAPKVDGASALLAAMPHLPLQQLLLFSSVASLVGAAGQANYVSANATLDSWAAAARCCGCAASSIQWGAWASAGELVCTMCLLLSSIRFPCASSGVDSQHVCPATVQDSSLLVAWWIGSMHPMAC
jgi:hypothetical protein